MINLHGSWFDPDVDEDWYEIAAESEKNSIQALRRLPQMITVKIAKLGERTREYALAEGATVQDLLDAAQKDGVEVSGYQARIDSEKVETSQQLYDGDMVQLLHAPKGG